MKEHHKHFLPTYWLGVFWVMFLWSLFGFRQSEFTFVPEVSNIYLMFTAFMNVSARKFTCANTSRSKYKNFKLSST